MNWWCSAQGGAWDWTWQPYVGVWLLVALLAGGRLALERFGAASGEPRRPHLVVRFLIGVLVLWIAADWPVGPLGAGYLLSVHTAQYILFAFVAPPLLLSGTPPWFFRRLIGRNWAFRLAWGLTRPLPAFAVFNVVLLATHMPGIVDGLTVSQIGSFAIDMSWLFAGLIFWWPILGLLPELKPMPYPGRIAYLFANVFIPTVPASFLTFARYPIYALYELSQPVSGLSTVEDQQIAGLIMKIVGGFIVFGTASVLFFKWAHAEERRERPGRHGGGSGTGTGQSPAEPTVEPA